MQLIRKVLSKTYAPRWLILQIDLAFCIIAVVLGYLLRQNFDIYAQDFETLPLAIGIFLVIRGIFFYFVKTYQGVVRFTSVQDAKKIFYSLTLGTLFLTIFNFTYFLAYGKTYISFAVVIFEYFATALMMSSFRIFVKIIYSEIKSTNTSKSNIIIYGAGESGVITKRTVDQDKDSGRNVVCFFDDDIKKKGKNLVGIPIYNTFEDFHSIVSKQKINELIISIQEIPRKRKEEIVDLCLQYKIHVKTVPPAADWINGELKLKQIKDIHIEDLLEREAITLDQNGIFSELNDRVVMVTGACGSIGSELVRQIIKFYPQKLLLIDQAETPMNDLKLELDEKDGYINTEILLCDVRNVGKMEEIIQKFKPSIIYHAAAYKHVPLMEDNPEEAVRTNISATKNLADLAVKYNVEKFVFISTDKAVNPTNIMGASKRIAEIYVQSLNSHLTEKGAWHTKFITTRFGNVLGSNGSVIPRFRKQMESGGPITVTHPEISRYFMTIPEACQLILEAGWMGNGGEIYVFDMGESVKIIDLAKKMVSLSGLVIGKDIQIVFTGLRPGEKIKEELLNNKEKTLPTHHSKIMIGKVREYPLEVVEKEVNDLLELLGKNSNTTLVKKMKAIVPEFVSNNSVYEELDEIHFHETIPNFSETEKTTNQNND